MINRMLLKNLIQMPLYLDTELVEVEIFITRASAQLPNVPSQTCELLTVVISAL